ncbi:MAG TPA: DUF5985 family protein [Thermoanaerobaculia bacterium]|nr:DUF5985 family protein [Thermoanaerobaculia bacterium]
MLGNLVYILCAVTSILCAILLFRGYQRSRARLLLWSGVCFIGLALNNVLLVIDVRAGAAMDLSLWRIVPAVIGAGALLYGLIWEAQ